MKIQVYFVNLFLAGLLLGGPLKTLANEGKTPESATDESNQEADFDESFDVVAVDYCYMGSTVNPTTGEIVDLYRLCADGPVEENMDLG
jgi:hypothetical protein